MHPIEISVYLLVSYHVMVFRSTDFVASAARAWNKLACNTSFHLSFDHFDVLVSMVKKDLSIYTLSDLSVLSNLLGSLFLTIQK